MLCSSKHYALQHAYTMPCSTRTHCALQHTHSVLCSLCFAAALHTVHCCTHIVLCSTSMMRFSISAMIVCPKLPALPPPPPPPSSFPSSPPSPPPFPPFPFAACLPCFASIMWARLGGPMLLRKNIMNIVNRWLDFSKKNWGSKHHHVIIQRGLHRRQCINASQGLRLYWMHMTALDEWLVITTTSPLAYLLRIQMSTSCSRSMHRSLSIMLAMLCSIACHTLQRS